MSQSAADLIKIEQARARHVEGYTPAHDAGHERDLVAAGAAYALDALGRVWVGPNGGSSSPVSPWPWAEEFWKPTDDVKRELVKVGSLIASAIDAMIAEENLVAEQMMTYDSVTHRSDCALHNEPAYPAKPCDCGAISREVPRG